MELSKKSILLSEMDLNYNHRLTIRTEKIINTLGFHQAKGTASCIARLLINKCRKYSHNRIHLTGQFI